MTDDPTFVDKPAPTELLRLPARFSQYFVAQSRHVQDAYQGHRARTRRQIDDLVAIGGKVRREGRRPSREQPRRLIDIHDCAWFGGCGSDPGLSKSKRQ